MGSVTESSQNLEKREEFSGTQATRDGMVVEDGWVVDNVAKKVGMGQEEDSLALSCLTSSWNHWEYESSRRDSLRVLDPSPEVFTQCLERGVASDPGTLQNRPSLAVYFFL